MPGQVCRKGVTGMHSWRCQEISNPLFSVLHLVHVETQKWRMHDTGHSDIGHLLEFGPGFIDRVSRVSRLRVRVSESCQTATVVNVRICKCECSSDLTTIAETPDIRSLNAVSPAILYYTVGHKKTCHFYFFDNSGKYWRIFVIFSLLYSGRNCGIRAC